MRAEEARSPEIKSLFAEMIGPSLEKYLDRHIFKYLSFLLTSPILQISIVNCSLVIEKNLKE